VDNAEKIAEQLAAIQNQLKAISDAVALIQAMIEAT
jgi:hypothetical protein